MEAAHITSYSSYAATQCNQLKWLHYVSEQSKWNVCAVKIGAPETVQSSIFNFFK